MAHSYGRIIVHIVWNTKYRGPFLLPIVNEAICAYIAGILEGVGSKTYALYAMYDHIHLVCTLPRTLCAADLMKTVKINSSIWIKDAFPGMSDFKWQVGYGIFSVDHHSLRRTVNYVEKQHEHHLRQPKYQNYEAQLRELLDFYKVDFDETYFLK